MYKLTIYGKYNIKLNSIGVVMQINKLNNIVFLKDVESNIIEEAFVVLKEKVKINDIKENVKVEEKNKINILKEAETLINSKLDETNINYEKFKVKTLENKYKKLKIINSILLIFIGILSILLKLSL